MSDEVKLRIVGLVVFGIVMVSAFAGMAFSDYLKATTNCEKTK